MINEKDENFEKKYFFNWLKANVGNLLEKYIVLCIEKFKNKITQLLLFIYIINFNFIIVLYKINLIKLESLLIK